MISRILSGLRNLHGSRAGRVTAIACAMLLGAAMCRAETPAAPATEPPADVKKIFTQKIPGTDVSFDMVSIPAGKFMMGSPATEKGRKKDEGPQFEVQVDPFYMAACPVTWDEYQLFLLNYSRIATKGAIHIPKDKWSDAVTYPTPMYELEAGPALERMGRPGKFPAVIMSQLAARQYTKWLSMKTGRFYRLPTEAEWEYAARAGTTTAYSFGDDPKKLGDYSWNFDNSALADGDGAYRKVGTKKPNPWGLYDMHGNVANWCFDQYDANWYQKFEGKSVNWHDVINWPNKQYPRVIRGGSWNDDADACRSSARRGSSRDLNTKDPQIPQSPHWMTEGFWLGFRVLSPAKEPPEAEKLKFWDVDDAYTSRILERDREIREDVHVIAKDSAAEKKADEKK